MTDIYDITVEIVYKKSYLEEAETIEQAYVKALEDAIKDHPKADVWIHKG